MRLRVVMLLHGWPPVVGGAQRQAQRLAPLLVAAGLDVVVVARAAQDAVRIEDRVLVHLLGTGWGGPRSGAAFVARAGRLTRALRPDVVHAHDLLAPATAGVLAVAGRETPLVAKVASVGPGGDLDVAAARRGGGVRLRVLLRRVDAFACLTDDVAGDLEAAGAEPGRLRRLDNGVDVRRFTPAGGPPARRAARRRLGLPEGGSVAVFCGRLRAVKRLDVLAQACAAARVRLVLVGEGPEAGMLARRPGVTVLGARDDVRAALHAADVYASASLTEGLSGSMLEALACGLPVVAAPASGVSDLVGDGRCGRAAADGGVAALTVALREVLARDDDGATARAARERAVSGYALDAVAAAYAGLYRELVAGRGKGR